MKPIHFHHKLYFTRIPLTENMYGQSYDKERTQNSLLYFHSYKSLKSIVSRKFVNIVVPFQDNHLFSLENKHSTMPAISPRKSASMSSSNLEINLSLWMRFVEVNALVNIQRSGLELPH